jgi:hypothetical protein
MVHEWIHETIHEKKPGNIRETIHEKKPGNIRETIHGTICGTVCGMFHVEFREDKRLRSTRTKWGTACIKDWTEIL